MTIATPGRRKHASAVILASGNALRGGEVVWWDGAGWSADFAAAAPVASAADGDALLARDTAAGLIIDARLVEARRDDSGTGWWPLHIKERIRASGPTVGFVGDPASESVVFAGGSAPAGVS